MQSLQSPVGTHCVGYAYNLAGFLLAAGEKVIYVSQKECIKCNDARVLICINNFCDGFWSIMCFFVWICKGSSLYNATFENCFRVASWSSSWSGLNICQERLTIYRYSYAQYNYNLFVFIIFLPNDAVQADDIQNETNELLRIRDYLFKELAQKTGQPVEKV